MRKYTWLKGVVIFILALTVNMSFASNVGSKTFIFFYSGDCKYCEEMADILVKIKQKHKIKIVANSLDGKKIEQFPNALHNNDISRKFRIISTPTIVAVDMQNQTFEMVSIELETQAMLEAKIMAVLNG